MSGPTLPPRSDRLARARAVAGLRLEAALALLGRQIETEWAGSALHRLTLARPVPTGMAAAARELRPPDLARGRSILKGRFALAGQVLEVGPGGDPWNRPSPNRPFAEVLHRMDWLPDLLALPEGRRAALSLALGWRSVFGRWNAFSWSAPMLQRRAHNLACALPALLAEAGPDDRRLLLSDLARHGRMLLATPGDPARHADQAAAAALCGAVLAGEAGEALLDRALPWLERTLDEAILPDGGHASRAPEAGLELLLDLRILADALAARGRQVPGALAEAIGRMGPALRVTTLGDGALLALQGGRPCDPARVAAAAEPGAEAPAPRLPDCGFERLEGRTLTLLADAGAPTDGIFAGAACPQLLAIEVSVGAERLIASPAWSPAADAVDVARLAPAASTATVDELSCGAPLAGWLAAALGPRLAGAPRRVRARRQDGDAASWLELGHDGWLERFGLIQERRLYLDRAADELRGEDLLAPRGAGRESPHGRKLVVRFLVPAPAKASAALDGRSVLLQPRGAAAGAWWLRTDAPEIAVEAGLRLGQGRAEPAARVVLRAPLAPDGAARVRWKLSRA